MQKRIRKGIVTTLAKRSYLVRAGHDPPRVAEYRHFADGSVRRGLFNHLAAAECVEGCYPLVDEGAFKRPHQVGRTPDHGGACLVGHEGGYGPRPFNDLPVEGEIIEREELAQRLRQLHGEVLHTLSDLLRGCIMLGEVDNHRLSPKTRRNNPRAPVGA